MRFYFLFFLFGYILQAQELVQYHLTYSPPQDYVTVQIRFKPQPAGHTRLIIPRSAPGTYEITNYRAFVSHVTGLGAQHTVLKGEAGEGSFFTFGESSTKIHSVQYRVDILKMEKELLGAYASSKLRKDYLGLLGYSVFGFIEGLEGIPVELTLDFPANWPLFSTLEPTTKLKKGKAIYRTGNFALLADAQFLTGTALQIKKVNDAPVPLFIALYSETDADIQEAGRQALLALNALNEYFGYIPMPHYTVCYEFLEPISKRHEYGFNMEHLNSMTSSRDVTKAIRTFDPNPNIGSVIHHMGHSWIPLRSYGTGYRPFEWQTAPLIDTIWLNEGFIWYVTYIDILKDTSKIKFFKETLAEAPGFIRQKSLRELSYLGSTQYSLDFRIGKNLIARGALMALEMDTKIKKESNGQKSFKDALLGLLEWTKINKRAFKYDEIESVMSRATGVDLAGIWKKWQN